MSLGYIAHRDKLIFVAYYIRIIKYVTSVICDYKELKQVEKRGQVSLATLRPRDSFHPVASPCITPGRRNIYTLFQLHKINWSRLEFSACLGGKIFRFPLSISFLIRYIYFLRALSVFIRFWGQQLPARPSIRPFVSEPRRRIVCTGCWFQVCRRRNF